MRHRWTIEFSINHAVAMQVIQEATGENQATIIRQLVLEADHEIQEQGVQIWRLSHYHPAVDAADGPRHSRWTIEHTRLHVGPMNRLMAAIGESQAAICRQLVLRRANRITAERQGLGVPTTGCHPPQS